MNLQDIHKEREVLEREHCFLYPSFMVDFINENCSRPLSHDTLAELLSQLIWTKKSILHPRWSIHISYYDPHSLRHMGMRHIHTITIHEPFLPHLTIPLIFLQKYTDIIIQDGNNTLLCRPRLVIFLLFQLIRSSVFD